MHISDIYLDKFVKKISTLIFSIIHIKLSNLMRERMEAKKIVDHSILDTLISWLEAESIKLTSEIYNYKDSDYLSTKLNSRQIESAKDALSDFYLSVEGISIKLKDSNFNTIIKYSLVESFSVIIKNIGLLIGEFGYKSNHELLILCNKKYQNRKYQMELISDAVRFTVMNFFPRASQVDKIKKKREDNITKIPQSDKLTLINNDKDQHIEEIKLNDIDKSHKEYDKDIESEIEADDDGVEDDDEDGDDKSDGATDYGEDEDEEGTVGENTKGNEKINIEGAKVGEGAKVTKTDEGAKSIKVDEGVKGTKVDEGAKGTKVDEGVKGTKVDEGAKVIKVESIVPNAPVKHETRGLDIDEFGD